MGSTPFKGLISLCGTEELEAQELQLRRQTCSQPHTHNATYSIATDTLAWKSKRWQNTSLHCLVDENENVIIISVQELTRKFDLTERLTPTVREAVEDEWMAMGQVLPCSIWRIRWW